MIHPMYYHLKYASNNMYISNSLNVMLKISLIILKVHYCILQTLFRSSP